MCRRKKQRNEDIKAAYQAGEIMTGLAEWHQISKQRVFEICTGYVSPSRKRKRRSKGKPKDRILHRHMRFIKIRLTVLKRDNFTCQCCESESSGCFRCTSTTSYPEAEAEQMRWQI